MIGVQKYVECRERRLKNTHKIEIRKNFYLKTAFPAIFVTEKAVFLLFSFVCFCSALNESAPLNSCLDTKGSVLAGIRLLGLFHIDAPLVIHYKLNQGLGAVDQRILA